MPGLPLPLWYRETRPAGGATVELVGGSHAEAVLVVHGGVADQTFVGGARQAAEVVFRGGATIDQEVGGALYGVVVVKGGGASADFAGGAAVRAALVVAGGAEVEYSAGALAAVEPSLRGGGVLGLEGGARHKSYVVPILEEDLEALVEVDRARAEVALEIAVARIVAHEARAKAIEESGARVYERSNGSLEPADATADARRKDRAAVTLDSATVVVER